MRSREGKRCVNHNCPFKLRGECGRYLNVKLADKTSYTPKSRPEGGFYCVAFDRREGLE